MPHLDPMRRSVHTAALFLAVGVAPACEDGPPWATREEPPPIEARHDFGPTAAYARRLIFLGPGTRLPTAAIFDFTSLSDSVGVRRGVRARLLTGDEWQPLIDAGWEFEPMREPWRVVPGDGLKIVVDDGGELAAVVHAGDREVRLHPGARLAESSPDVGTRFVLRQAMLVIDGETLRGILLDSQLGRAVHPAAVPRPFTTDTGPDAPAEPDTAPTDEGGDTARTGRPTPIARAGAEAFLVNNGGYYAVFATSAAGAIGWVSHAGRDQIHRGVALRPTTWSTPPEEEFRMPVQWRIGGAGSNLQGELAVAATDPSPLPDLGDLTALGYLLVSGWIEEGGVRRDVVGFVRHVR